LTSGQASRVDGAAWFKPGEAIQRLHYLSLEVGDDVSVGSGDDPDGGGDGPESCHRRMFGVPD
jgi:hypothetical protein